jgi:hypothetical protein
MAAPVCTARTINEQYTCVMPKPRAGFSPGVYCESSGSPSRRNSAAQAACRSPSSVSSGS